MNNSYGYILYTHSIRFILLVNCWGETKLFRTAGHYYEISSLPFQIKHQTKYPFSSLFKSNEYHTVIIVTRYFRGTLGTVVLVMYPLKVVSNSAFFFLLSETNNTQYWLNELQ